MGAVGTANSLTGNTASYRVGSWGVVGLSNGNYLVSSPEWNFVSTAGTIDSAGAVTWVNGADGVLLTGAVGGSPSSLNSLIGSTAFDQVGSRPIQALAAGNAVVSSPGWDRGVITDAGPAPGSMERWTRWICR